MISRRTEVRKYHDDKSAWLQVDGQIRIGCSSTTSIHRTATQASSACKSSLADQMVNCIGSDS